MTRQQEINEIIELLGLTTRKAANVANVTTDKMRYYRTKAKEVPYNVLLALRVARQEREESAIEYAMKFEEAYRPTDIAHTRKELNKAIEKIDWAMQIISHVPDAVIQDAIKKQFEAEQNT